MDTRLPRTSHRALPVAELESIYDALALAIDRATESRSELFLAKLALLAAAEIGEPARFNELIETALKDL